MFDKIYSNGAYQYKANKKPPLHYLLSVALSKGDHAHAYVMSADHDAVERVTQRMLDDIQRAGYAVRLPVCLATVLDASGVKKVRAFLRENVPEARKLLETAKDFHYSSWGMRNDDPDAGWLMELH